MADERLFLPPRVYVPRASRERTTHVTAPARVAAPRHAVAPKKRVAPKATHKTYRTNAPVPTGAFAWANTRSAYRVANCESGDRSASDVNTRYNGDPHLRDGKYHGKWQMDADFWSTYGGKQYASDAADATETQQDAVAYKGYLARGWQPWSCSRIMGVR